MGSISQIKLPNNSNYNLSVPFIVGTGSTAGTWLGTLTGLTAYYDGLLILYKPSVAGASTTTLNINNIGAKTCYLNSTGKLTTHYPANQPILLVYSSSQNSGCWMAIDNYDSNSNTYDRNKYAGTIKAGTSALVAGNIIVGKDGVFNHLKSGGAFDISYPILYLNSAVDANKTTTDTYDILHITITTTQSISLTAYLPVYIKGTLAGSIFTPVSTTPLTQTVPTSADGYYYMYLGNATAATTVYIQETHPIFAYKNGAFGQIVNDAMSVNGYTVAKSVPSNAVFTDNNTTYTFANGTNGFTVTPSGGSAQTVTVTPSITNNVTGSGTNGKVAKFTGANTIGDGYSVDTTVTSGSGNLITSGAVYTAIDNLPEPMVFKGSLGTGGTITALPVDGSASIGDTYKVITAGTYASQAAKVGDTFICDSKTSSANTWTLIPSGDEPSGTVTSVTIKATSPIAIDSSSAITTSGTRTLSHANSGATAGSYGDSSAQTPGYGSTFKVPYVTVNATGHVTAISDHTVKIPASDNTTYTFANGTNGFTVTPSGGTAQTVTVTPSITNNVTGSGTSGYIAKFNGTNTITNGPAFGSTTTTYLNNAGSWATPPDTKNTAGSTDTSSKIFLVGATSQAANPQTYSDNEVFATSGVLTTKSVQVGGGSATMQYNATTQAIDFIFA